MMGCDISRCSAIRKAPAAALERLPRATPGPPPSADPAPARAGTPPLSLITGKFKIPVLRPSLVIRFRQVPSPFRKDRYYMAGKVVSLRLDEELLEWATSYAAERGVSRTDLLVEGLRSFQEDCESGVPEIRAAIKRQVGQADEAAGVGDCPKRGPLLGHIWKSRQEDPDRSCRHCGLKGRAEQVKGEHNEGHLSRFGAERVEVFSRLDPNGAMVFGTGKPRQLTPEQQARADAIVADKKRRDAEAVADGSARPGQVAGVKGQR